MHFAEGCVSPCSAHNGSMRQNSYADIWAIIFHLLLPLRTSTVAELGGLFYRDFLEQTSDQSSGFHSLLLLVRNRAKTRKAMKQ